jgi:hypothetical protein
MLTSPSSQRLAGAAAKQGAATDQLPSHAADGGGAAGVGALQLMTRLSLYENELAEVPAELGQLDSLQEL